MKLQYPLGMYSKVEVKKMIDWANIEKILHYQSNPASTYQSNPSTIKVTPHQIQFQHNHLTGPFSYEETCLNIQVTDSIISCSSSDVKSNSI